MSSIVPQPDIISAATAEGPSGTLKRRDHPAREQPTPPRSPCGTLIIHSDRGSRTARMPSSARCAITSHAARWDGLAPARATVAMASLYSLLQSNVLDRRRLATRDRLRLAIITRSNGRTSARADKAHSSDRPAGLSGGDIAELLAAFVASSEHLADLEFLAEHDAFGPDLELANLGIMCARPRLEHEKRSLHLRLRAQVLEYDHVVGEM